MRKEMQCFFGSNLPPTPLRKKKKPKPKQNKQNKQQNKKQSKQSKQANKYKIQHKKNNNIRSCIEINTVIQCTNIIIQ